MNIRKETLVELCGLVPASQICNDERCYYLQLEVYRETSYTRSLSILQTSQALSMKSDTDYSLGIRSVVKMARNRKFYHRFRNKSLLKVEYTNDKDEEE